MKHNIHAPIADAGQRFVLVLILLMPSTPSGATTHTYDVDGRLTRVAYANGKAVNYAYDSAGNIVQISSTAIPPDTTRSSVKIVAPAAGSTVTNPLVAVAGTATDDVEVDYVMFQINSDPWKVASATNAWANWAGSAVLKPGANTISAYAVDSSGNSSITNSVKCFYAVTSPLTLSAHGPGTVSGVVNGQNLVVGQAYTATAKPANGCVFSNWTGTVSSTLAALKFTMQSNMVLQANFVTNPFAFLGATTPAATRTYQGLFYVPDGVAVESSGAITITPNSKGAYTGRISILGWNQGFSGTLTVAGNATTTVSVSPSNTLTISLQLDLADNDVITGLVSNGRWTAELTANRAGYSKAHPAPQGGKKYTMVISGAAEGTNQPGGCGFGTVNVDTAGNVSFVGTLGDGTNVTQSSVLSKHGEWPLYVSLYSGQGVLLGWVTFTNEPQTDFRGLLGWIKQPQPAAKLYPAGFVFTNGVEVLGSVYTNKAGTPVFSWTNGLLTLESVMLRHFATVNSFAIGANNAGTGTNKLSLQIAPATGVFQGSTTSPVTNQTVGFRGVVFQKLNAGYGAYYLTNGTGSAQIGPSGGGGAYGALWQSIPGTIHLERFDMGGEGVAYHYPRGTNDWGSFRNENIVIGYNANTSEAILGWLVDGEWIDYSVNVQEPGKYSFVVPAATPVGGGIVHFEVDGVDATGPMAIPSTASYGDYQPMQKDGVYLTGGHHVLRMVMDKLGPASANIHSFDVVGPGYPAGFVWERAATWSVSNSIPDQASKNDSLGNAVWDYVVVDGGSFLNDGGSAKWWMLNRTPMQPGNWFGAPVFEYLGSTLPYAAAGALQIDNDNDSLAPLVIWRNPAGEAIKIKVGGRVEWVGDGTSNSTAADYVLAIHNAAANTWTVLDSNVFTPISGGASANAANERNYDGAQAFPPIMLNAGDEIVWGFKRHGRWNGGAGWFNLDDSRLILEKAE